MIFFFENLNKTMDGVMPTDVINYDETNFYKWWLGKEKCFVQNKQVDTKMKVVRDEQLMNQTKSDAT